MDQPAEDRPDYEMILHSAFLEKDSPVRKDRRNLPHWCLGGSFCFLT
ncbi:MAG: hypothetical protein L3K26_19945 [Candidatus Hydrogenedentes bacterium]|nr:hypothetical protein [Candidatus Hydrogenedentota bacterium]